MHRAFQPILCLLCLLPVISLFGLGITDSLGANPIETVVRSLGDWGFRLILIGLFIPVLVKLTGKTLFNRWRRIIGLAAFGYVVLHLLAWLGLDQGFYWPAIVEDITKRTYILLGMAAFLLLVPLAVTSSNRMIQRLGYARWKRLHRLVYPASILVAVHYLLLVKADRITAAVYAMVLAVLLLVRVWWWWRDKKSFVQG